MYEVPERWGGMFQSYSQLTMLDLHTKPHVSKNHLHHVFIYYRKHELYYVSRDWIQLVDIPPYFIIEIIFAKSNLSVILHPKVLLERGLL